MHSSPGTQSLCLVHAPPDFVAPAGKHTVLPAAVGMQVSVVLQPHCGKTPHVLPGGALGQVGAAPPAPDEPALPAFAPPLPAIEPPLPPGEPPVPAVAPAAPEPPAPNADDPACPDEVPAVLDVPAAAIAPEPPVAFTPALPWEAPPPPPDPPAAGASMHARVAASQIRPLRQSVSLPQPLLDDASPLPPLEHAATS
jgi:hypothetical protein